MRRVSLSFLKVPKAPQFALSIALIVFTVSLLAGLKADASPMPTQTLSGTITTSQTLNPSIVYVIDNFVVGNGATLTIPAGTIVKLSKYSPVVVENGGSLRVTGTSANPVHFTSVKDDSLGGDTNGDGSASSPSANDYYRAVLINGGETNIVSAKFRYFSLVAIEGTRADGSVVITDSAFDDGSSAISVQAPTVKLYRNKFNNLNPNVFDYVVHVGKAQDLTKISLSGIDQNIFTGTNKFARIISLGGVTLPAGKTWTHAGTSGATVRFVDSNYINGTANIGPNAALVLNSFWRAIEVRGVLNIQEGAWVKHSGNGSVHVLIGGKLNVIGSALNPIRLTSVKDDTVGGDTNGDGSTSVPAIGDSHNVISGEGGDITLSYAKFSYFGAPVGGDTDKLVVTDSTFQDCHSALLAYSVKMTTIKRNTFNLSPEPPFVGIEFRDVPDISGISLSGSDHNTFIGEPYQRTILINSSTLPSDKTFTVSAEGSPVLAMGEDRTNINGTFNIGQGAVMILRGSRWSSTLNLTGTLNVYEGSIVKFDNTTGISVKEGANLNINGTSTQKVHFTSYRDDSVGGDTNGDGNATNPSLIDSTTMLNMDGGTAYVINASFNFASRNIVGTTTSPSLKVFDSSFANSGSAIDVSVSNIKIYRNTFNVQPDYIFNPVALRNVTDISRFGLSGSDQNFFTGTSPHSRIVQFSDSALPSDRSFVVTQSSGAALKFKGDHNNIYGNLTVSDNGTLITEGGYYSPAPNLYGTLTVKKGSTIKAAYTSGINVMDGGKLNLLGDANNRIKVTHYSDDALGGDTNGDGNNTVPQTGGYSVAHTSGGEVVANFADIYYAGAIFSVTNGKVNADNIRSSNSMQLASVGTNGEAMITNAQISNAKTGLSVSGSGRVVLRGSLISSQSKAVEACNWGQSCSVDAAYVDWGTGGAPAAGMVCGQVTVSPWANGSASSSDGLFTSKNCDNLPTPADQLASSTQHFGQRMSTRGIDCGNGFEDACEAMRNAQRCIGAATDLAASTSSFPLPSSNPYEQPAQFGEVLASGVTAYIQEKEGAIPILTALEFGDKLIEALETVMNVADAYNTCAP